MMRDEDYCNHPNDVGPMECPCCGSPGTSYSECCGGNMYGDNVYHAVAGCSDPDCEIRFEEYWEGDGLLDDEDCDTEGCAELERRAIVKWNRRYEGAAIMHDGVSSCPFCGGRAYSMHEDMGEGVHGGTDWEAHAYCPSCGGGIDLYVEESTDPNAGKYLEWEVVKRWNRRVE